MRWEGRLLLSLALVACLGDALPSQKAYEVPILVDQTLVALAAEPILDDPNVVICHGPEDCNNHGVCDLNNLCRCSPGWGGVDCSVEFTCPDDCNGNGVCRAHTCFCYHGYTGRDCKIELFCPNNCNSNGRCDRGQCVCEPGFDGEDCSIEVGCAYECKHGRCEKQVCVCEEGYYGADCSDIDYCITDCSGHGQCKDRRCTCDFGYTGVVCSTLIPCPHNCSHKGECVNGTCLCDLGYTGLDCSEDCCPDQNSQCSAGKMCSYPPCHCHNDCNDNGICHRGRCICRQGFFGDDCAQKYCPANCSNHGSCDNTIGECTCEHGWKGKDCAEVECPNDCSNRGECMLFGGTDRICLCLQGYTGSDCSEEIPCPSDCSGNGKCKLGVCFCSNGWNGTDCSEEIEKGVPCEDDCHDHGRCEDGICVECDEGWMGRYCEIAKPTPTPPVIGSDGEVVEPRCPGEPECSDHGLCGPGGKCFCSPDWHGDDCGIKKCPDNCNDRGKCSGGVCMCEAPYYSGPLQSCEFIHCPNNCSGPSHGNCLKSKGQCSCIPPWTGDDCSVQPCPGDPECSDQGECDHSSGTCSCLPDYAGEDCNIFMRCPNDCSGNGVCYRGVCYCYANYTGEACKSIKRPPPPPGYDWEAPLRAAQNLVASSRATEPPRSPTPASFTVDDQKTLFKQTYGAEWLKFWNLVHSTPNARVAFGKAVVTQPPSVSGQTSQALLDAQMTLFKQVFGATEWQNAWTRIMADEVTKKRFQNMFGVTDGSGDGTDSQARGPGLPPPPPPARDETVVASRQRLFTDVFGQGEGLAMEMLIMGDRTKRDLFTQAFSDFLKNNMQRAAADKRASWEDDMLQLMTDAMGSNGPRLLREIYADPTRATAFRNAFSGYLEETPGAGAVQTLIQTEEGQEVSTPSARRTIPMPV